MRVRFHSWNRKGLYQSFLEKKTLHSWSLVMLKLEVVEITYCASFMLYLLQITRTKWVQSCIVRNCGSQHLLGHHHLPDHLQIYFQEWICMNCQELNACNHSSIADPEGIILAWKWLVDESKLYRVLLSPSVHFCFMLVTLDLQQKAYWIQIKNAHNCSLAPQEASRFNPNQWWLFYASIPSQASNLLLFKQDSANMSNL